MSDTNAQTGAAQRPARPTTPPFKGPADLGRPRPLLQPIVPFNGRETLPPYLPPVRFGGPLPGAAGQPGLIATPAATAGIDEEPAVTHPNEGWQEHSEGLGIAAASGITASAITASVTTGAPPDAVQATVSDQEQWGGEEVPAGDTGAGVPTEYALDAQYSQPASSPAQTTAADHAEAWRTPRSAEAHAAPPVGESRESEVVALGRGDQIGDGGRPAYASASDPFEESFGRSSLETPLGESEHDRFASLSHDLSADGIRHLGDTDYLVQLPVPSEPWSPPGLEPLPTQPRQASVTTPVLGIPVVPAPPTSQRVRYTPAQGAPRRVTPTMSPRIVTPASTTPISTPVVPHTPIVPHTPVIPMVSVRTPTPTRMVVGGTPLSVPAVPDLAGARAVAEALETVAARVRAGEIQVGGGIPTGSGPDVLAAGLAAALAALLGVRR